MVFSFEVKVVLLPNKQTDWFLGRGQLNQSLDRLIGEQLWRAGLSPAEWFSTVITEGIIRQRGDCLRFSLLSAPVKISCFHTLVCKRTQSQIFDWV